MSWIVPPLGYDEHPPSPPALGAWFIDQVLSTLVSNPEVWQKTVLFVMYDENDGFFDHVAPPVAPAGTPGEYVTVDPLPVDGPRGGRARRAGLAGADAGGLPVQPGRVRVLGDVRPHLPAPVPRGAVRVVAPNISAWRRKTVGDLTSTLRMGQPVTSVPRLPSTADDTPAGVEQLGCEATDIIQVRTDQPAYPLPDPQRLPTQEPGRARRVPGRTV